MTYPNEAKKKINVACTFHPSKTFCQRQLTLFAKTMGS